MGIATRPALNSIPTWNASHPQSLLDLADGSDTVGTISVGDSGVLLVGIVAEQEHLLAVKGVFGPGNARQWAGSGGTTGVVGILMVDEIHCHGPRQQARLEGKGMQERVRTESVCPDVVTGEIVHLRKFATVDRADV